MLNAVNKSERYHNNCRPRQSVAWFREMAELRGRPPAGRDEKGRPVAVTKSYVQLTLRVPPETKAIVDSLSVIEQKGQAQVVEDAVAAYVGALSAPARRAVNELKTAKLATAKKRA